MVGTFRKVCLGGLDCPPKRARKLILGVGLRFRIYGCYQHPTSESITDARKHDHIKHLTEIDATRISHRIENLSVGEGGVWCGQHYDSLVYADITPCGPFGHLLQHVLESTHDTPYFGVRALVRHEHQDGRYVQHYRKLITWDFLTTERIAQKAETESLMRKSSTIELPTPETRPITDPPPPVQR